MATRRTILTAAASVPVLATAAGARAQPAARRTYVLVHGAFHGGWCWRRVSDRLTAAGHRVFAPTQTGLGERRHLMSQDISLETFVQDVTNLIEAEELQEVYLVGHSFGGRTVHGVVDRMPERIARLVLLDTGRPVSGRSALDDYPPAIREERVRMARESGDGMSMAVPRPEFFGVTAPEDVAWLARRMTPQPFSTYNSALTLNGPPGNGRPVTYIRCTQPRYVAVDPGGDYAKTRADWEYLEIAAAHDAMVIAPERLSEMLLGLQ